MALHWCGPVRQSAAAYACIFLVRMQPSSRPIRSAPLGMVARSTSRAQRPRVPQGAKFCVVLAACETPAVRQPPEVVGVTCAVPAG